MKKLLLTSCLFLAALFTVQAQEGLKASAHIGIPTGDASDYFGVNFGANVSYLYPVMENIHLGGMAGLDIFSGKEITNTGTRLKGLTLLPIAASGQYDIMDQFFAGLDVGFALSLSKDYKGGFFFQPKGGWQNEFFQVFAFYKSFSSKLDVPAYYSNFSNVGTFGIGGAYKF